MIRQNKQSAISESPSRLEFTITRQVTLRDRFSVSPEKTITFRRMAPCKGLSVEPYQKHGAFRGLGLMGQIGRALAIVVQHAGTYPPSSRGTLKLDDFGRLVTPLQVLL